MMHEPEKSDSSIVAKKPANKSEQSEAESVEPREGAKGNTSKPHTHRTRSRDSVSTGLERVRERAKANKKERFTALLHHVTVDLLRTAYFKLKRDAAPGVDGTTWYEYGQDLEAKLVDLHGRVHRGAYRALPSRRKFIEKEDGRQRPLGIASLEDKIVQRAAVEVLNAIYGAPGEAWCFQRVKIPHRKGEEPPHRESSLGLMEVTTWVKRRQSDGRAVM
jgi:RNA-directed DNA polymerase